MTEPTPSLRRGPPISRCWRGQRQRTCTAPPSASQTTRPSWEVAAGKRSTCREFPASPVPGHGAGPAGRARG
ncbi:hypothetical protein QJS66_13625 [Kocuria rhizophila]|nr:hypothetical protein QJS66_13625 [Kocuria rhizophila]